MRHADFMKMINELFPTGGLTCSFKDHQLSEFIQIKKRTAAQVPMKLAVQDVGPQDEDLSVLALVPMFTSTAKGNPSIPLKASIYIFGLVIYTKFWVLHQIYLHVTSPYH